MSSYIIFKIREIICKNLLRQNLFLINYLKQYFLKST